MIGKTKDAQELRMGKAQRINGMCKRSIFDWSVYFYHHKKGLTSKRAISKLSAYV